MFSSYSPADVTVLLKDISGMVKPMAAGEREALIQKGVHYSELLPLEYEPSDAYLQAYERALSLYAGMTARAVAQVGDRIWQDKGKRTVLVSLARAGTPIGILIKRYMQKKYQVSVSHYTVSIIRGRGIDKNAMAYMLARHVPESLQFVDGWTGKGAIQRQVREAMEDYPGVDPGLAVLSDPACVAAKRGTYDDFLIASSCLNCTVSGLLSRTFYREDIIGPTDFHGAAFYRNLARKDVTYSFIHEIERQFPMSGMHSQEKNKEDLPKCLEAEENCSFEPGSGLREVEQIAGQFGIADINLVKPSIGEATRVLLRRVPWKILVHSLEDQEHLGHLYQLAEEKGVNVEEYPLKHYRACGLIRSMADN